MRVSRKDEEWSGLAFHGVPGGHEFMSFVLGRTGNGRPAHCGGEFFCDGRSLRSESFPGVKRLVTSDERPLPCDQ